MKEPVEPIFVGIDGGGTKTRLIAADGQGNIVSELTGGCLNYAVCGLDFARAQLKDIIDRLAAETGMAELYSLYMGCAALDGRAEGSEKAALTDGIVQARLLGMDSDIAIALESMDRDGPCAVAVCGTGSMAAARQNRDDTPRIAGGWGYLLGDEGSAYRIAADALRLAMRASDGCAGCTALTRAFLDHFGAAAMRDITGIVYGDGFSPRELAAAAPLVFDCADRGDVSARHVIADNISAFAASAGALVRDLPKGSPVGLWGGIFQHRPELRSAFARMLPGMNCYLLPVPPETGALYMAYRRAGLTIPASLRREI